MCAAVVGQTPEVEVGLRAALAAATADDEKGAEQPEEYAEPSSRLALASQVCGAGERGAAAAVGGAEGARLAAAGAARAGVPLLLLEPAPVGSRWEALAMFPHDDVLVQVCAPLYETGVSVCSPIS